jgi:hypothetical protein
MLSHVGDHEYACMHDLMKHLRNDPQASSSNVHDSGTLRFFFMMLFIYT